MALLFGLPLPSLQAVELADLVGDWTIADLQTPTRLVETFYNTNTTEVRLGTDSSDFAQVGEILVDAQYFDPALTEIRTFSVAAGGAVSGDEVGQILNISNNRLFYSDGTEITTVYSNLTGDIMMASTRIQGDETQNQAICMKRPASLATADMAGDWYVMSMLNFRDISKNIVDGRLADTWYVATPTNFGGDITIYNDGTFDGLFSGTSSAGATPGDFTVNVSGGDVVPFKCNASKNLACATPGDADEQEMVLLIRKPATLATADMAGTWRISAMQVPTTLTESYYNTETTGGRQAYNDDNAGLNEILVDVFHTDKFELSRFHAVVDASGTFTGSVSGSMSAVGTAMTVTVDGEEFILQPNADKTFMAGIKTYADSHELIVCVKVCEDCPNSFVEEVDLEPVRAGDTLIFSWNSGNNIKLQAANGLGGWTDVEAADGTDAYPVDVSGGGSAFYRVSEQASPPPP